MNYSFDPNLAINNSYLKKIEEKFKEAQMKVRVRSYKQEKNKK